MTSQRVSIIAAMSDGRVIGKGNQLPWHLPADLAWFKKTTMGKPIIMGRNTYDSIGHALPGRRNIVISRDTDLSINGCEVIHSPQAAIDATINEPEVMIIGGALIYKHFLPHVHRLYLTTIDAKFEGDTQFPDYENMADWKIISKEDHEPDEWNLYSYSFLTLDKQ